MLDVLCQKIELLTLSLNQLNPSYNLCIIFIFTSVVHIDNFPIFKETVQVWRALDNLEEACFTGREER